MSWGKELDYKATYEQVRLALVSKAKTNKLGKSTSAKTKLAIILICLRNGCRISEGIAAFQQFQETNLRKVQARVRKRGFSYIVGSDGKKKRASTSKDPEHPVFRDCIIPDEVPANLPPYRKTKANVLEFVRYHFGFNSHALRYCFITEASKQGVSPQVIAKITGQKTLNQILLYTEQAAGSEVLQRGLLK